MKRFGKNVSRRALVQSAGLAAGAGLFGLGRAKSLLAQSSGAAGQPRVLALIGDRHHNADYIRVSLDKVFKELNLPVDYTINYDKISADLLKNYKIFLVLREGQNWSNGYLGPDAASSSFKEPRECRSRRSARPVDD